MQYLVEAGKKYKADKSFKLCALVCMYMCTLQEENFHRYSNSQFRLMATLLSSISPYT